MSTEITLTDPQEGQITFGLAKALAASSWLPKQMQGNPSDVLLAMLTGRELGIGPMAALRLIYVVEGKPTISGQLQLALLRRAGHEVIEVEATPQKVVFEGRYHGRGQTIRVTYTETEARAAGLLTKNNWKSYPADMLYWRCVSRLARRLDPTATAGMYAPADFDQPEPNMTVTVEAVEPHPESAEVPPEAEIEARAEAPREDEARTTYLRDEVRRMLRDMPTSRKPTKKAMEAAGDPEAVHALVLAAYESSRAEEDAALRGEPGELPLGAGDAVPSILVGCPRCGEKVPTGELAEHLEIEHEGEK